MDNRATFFLSQELMKWTLYSLFLVIYFILIYGVIAHAITQDTSSGVIRNTLYSQKMYLDPCLTYSDGVRSYPGIIDLSKFTEETLASCGFDQELYTAEIELTFDQTKHLVYVHKDHYGLDQKLCAISNRYTCTLSDSFYVQVYRDGMLVPGTFIVRGISHEPA